MRPADLALGIFRSPDPDRILRPREPWSISAVHQFSVIKVKTELLLENTFKALILLIQSLHRKNK